MRPSKCTPRGYSVDSLLGEIRTILRTRGQHNVALVGAGNIHYGAMLRVPLTTVSWSRSEMGREVARLLIALIEDKSHTTRPEHVVLEPELIVRNSCGARGGSKPGLRLASK